MKSLRRAMSVADVALVALVLAAGVYWLAVGRGSTTDQQDVNGADRLQMADFLQLTADGWWFGPREAKVRILVYSDYACGFSATLNGSLDAIRERYPDHVAYIQKFYVQPSTRSPFRVAATVGCAAEQGVLEEYHEAAFRSSELAFHDSWRRIAREADVPDMEALEECVYGERYTGAVADNFAEGNRIGVRGTPTLFVNGRRMRGSVPFEILDSLVAAELAGRR